MAPVDPVRRRAVWWDLRLASLLMHLLHFFINVSRCPVLLNGMTLLGVMLIQSTCCPSRRQSRTKRCAVGSFSVVIFQSSSEAGAIHAVHSSYHQLNQRHSCHQVQCCSAVWPQCLLVWTTTVSVASPPASVELVDLCPLGC